MKKIKILYVGNHKDISDTVVRLINKSENWRGKGVQDIHTAMDDMKRTTYEIVLLGCGIAPEQEEQLRTFVEERFPHVKVVQHYGGGSGLLSNEILEALQQASPLMN